MSAPPLRRAFPSPAEEELSDILSLDDYLGTKKPSRFLLHVRGETMRDAGILPGDLLLVDRSLRPRPGDLLITPSDAGWRLRRLDAMPTAEPLAVAAVVTAVIRKCRQPSRCC